MIPGGDVDKEAFVETDQGRVVNSTTPDGGFSIDGLPPIEAIPKITAWLEANGKGRKSVNYKLRDWLFARQRYWGEPFPILWAEDHPRPLPEEHLPLLLPETSNLLHPEMAKVHWPISTDWLTTTDPASGKPARRETNTMPQWAGSCWYYLRFIDPKNAEQLVDPVKERYWMPVDLYIGGSEHAVLHLLVLSVLAQGVVRYRGGEDARTVQKIGPSGHRAGGRQPEDVQIARQCRQSG